MKHTLVALMQDRPGVLNRAVSLFRRRGFNIESLTVGHTEQPGISRMTLVVDATTTSVEQVIKQLYKLIEVLKVSDVTDDPSVDRELVLARIYVPAAKRPELTSLAELFEARVVDVALDSAIVELTASPEKMERFIELLRPFGIQEMVRTGRVAMVRGATSNGAVSEPRGKAA